MAEGAMAERPTTADDDVLLVSIDAGVATLTLNRPASLNATDESLHRALAGVWPRVSDDPEVRAVVLTGSGRAFSGGGDLDLLERMTNDLDLRSRIMAEAIEIVEAMVAVPVPIVAAVNGPAVGLGCSLAAMSDLVVMEEQAYYADPHVMLGLVAADGGALTWPLLTSLLRAKEFLLLGDRLPAAEALEMGLANRVVPTGTSVEQATALATRLAALPPQSVRETKAALNSTLRSVVATALHPAVAAESESFDEPAFRANLARMLERSR
jgi:enoyl-CoA hydratase